MDYFTIYHSIIESALKRGKTRFKYSAKHHIIPTACGGADAPDNWVFLTNREHLICHRLLVKIYPSKSWQKKKMVSAWWRMCNSKGAKGHDNVRVTSREYESARKAFSDHNPNKDPEAKARFSERYKQGLYKTDYDQVSRTLKNTLKKLTNQEMKDRMKKSVGSCDQAARAEAIRRGKASQFKITDLDGNIITVWTYEDVKGITGYSTASLRYHIKKNKGVLPDERRVEFSSRYSANDSRIGRSKNNRQDSKNARK